MPATSNQHRDGDSRAITSSQRFSHPKLGRLVRKHLSADFQRPVAQHTRAAFAAAATRVEKSGKPLVFDSFCGTGMSTSKLALRHPDCLVIGIDKSANRLQRHEREAGDYLLVRAECGDFWRLAAAQGWRAQRHYLLYPNPWPKPGQLKRRIHGSPDLKALLTLGGTVELRSNWQIYVEEFGIALTLAGLAPHVSRLPAGEPISLFERKYLQSLHPLWRCECQLSHNTRP
jgi:tRNA (guanine-N7-)-methyltransferase